MKIKEMMTTDVRTVGPETPLREAAAVMKMSGVGMLPVVGVGRVPVGVITDRDITVRVFANGIPGNTPVRDAMSNHVETIHHDQTLDDALVRMRAAKVGRLLVCDTEGRLEGVVSLGDTATYCDGDRHMAEVSRSLAERNRLAKRGNSIVHT